jgi:paired amphipathic helix protein Sin3a
MLFIAYITSPFVTFIHLVLPQYVRQSRKLMMRYAQNMSPRAYIDITTMNFIGRQRVSRIALSQLEPTKERLGVANYHIIHPETRRRSPWMPRPVTQFYARSKSGTSRELGVWEIIQKHITKNAMSRSSL